MIHESVLPLAHFLPKPVRSSRLGLMALSALLMVGTAQAQVTGISYSVSPSAEYIRFSDASALKGGLSFGGGVGFGFGEYLEVSGIYQYMPSLETDWSNLPEGYLRADLPDLVLRTQDLKSITSRNVSAQKYGGRLRLNVGDFRYKPYVVVGSGVLRMSPDGLESASVIYGELGVGATFSIVDRFALSIGVHDLAYRLNPSSTLLAPDEVSGMGLVPGDFEQKRVRNLGLVASARFYLAGRADGKLTDLDRAMMSQFRGGNFRVAIEPTYGQLKFNSSLGMSGSRAMAGVNAGFDLGPYIGLRGFYLRDTKQEKLLDGGLPKKFGKAAYYGGELQLRFAEQFSGGLLPYAILGGGFFDNNDDPGYVTTEGALFESRYFAILGGGIELPLGGAVRLHGAIRGLMMSSQDITDVAEASSVSASPMYTVGVGFNIGGSGRTLGRTIDERFASEREQAARERMTTEARQTEMEERQARLEQELIGLQTQLATALLEAEADSTALAGIVQELSESGAASKPTEKTGTKKASGNVVPVISTAAAGEVADYISEERVVIPVPKVGEIYIRYGNVTDAPSDVIAPPIVISTSGRMLDYGSGGTASGLTPEEMRTIIRQEILASQTALHDSNRVAIRAVEARLGNTLSTELTKLRTEMDEANSLRATSPTRVDSVANGQPVSGSASRQSALIRITPSDSVSADTADVDLWEIDSRPMDSVRTKVPPVDSLGARILRADSVRVGSSRIDSLGTRVMRPDSVRVDSVGIKLPRNNQ